MSEDARKCAVPAGVEWRESAAAVQNSQMRTIALEEHFWTAELAAAPGTGVLARADGARLDEALRDLDKARLTLATPPPLELHICARLRTCGTLSGDNRSVDRGDGHAG